MNKIIFVLTAIIISFTHVFSQNETTDSWQIFSSIKLLDLFPSKTIQRIEVNQYGPRIQNKITYRYEATGFFLTLKGYHETTSPFTYTFGTGVLWYSNAKERVVYYNYGSNSSEEGIGVRLDNKRFIVFPLAFGVEWYSSIPNVDKLQFFLGADGRINFIDGDIEIGEQSKLGFSVGGGFAFKRFEFGVRYYSLSDIQNIGVNFGLRLNPITIE